MKHWRAVIWAGIAAALIVGCVTVLFVGRAPIQTDLLALLPNTERHPTVERAASQVMDAGARRLIFLIGHPTAEKAKSAAQQFARDLSAGDTFKLVRAEFPTPDAGVLRTFYLPYRFQLLTDADRQALSAADADYLGTQLQRRLYDPFRRGLGTPLEQDPLGLFDAYLTALPFAQNAKLEFDGGYLIARDNDRAYALVFAELNGSAYDGDLQRRLSASLTRAENVLRAAEPDARVVRAGAVHHATAAREAAERELNLIGAGSLIGIAALLLWAFRSFRPIGLGLLSVAVGICAATLATIAVFGEIHIITLVFGASLTGEAVDYSIQYFAARLHAGKNWDARRGLHAVAPGIVVAVATSLLGYGALALTPFPALRQIALFAVVGLIAACLTVLLLLPALLKAPMKRQPRELLRRMSALLTRCQQWGTPRRRALLIAFLVVLAIPGWWRLSAQDDIRLLVNPPARLVTEQNTIQRLTGFSQSSQFFVVQGASEEEVLQREEQLTLRLSAIRQQGGLASYQAVSDFVPSAARQRENYLAWRAGVFSSPKKWRAALGAYGFKKSVINAQEREFRRADGRTLELTTWLQSPLSIPFRHLWAGAQNGEVASIVMPSGFMSITALQDAANNLAGVTLVDKVGGVSRLFGDYRRMGVVVLLVAAVLVYIVLALRYGMRRGLQALLPTVAGGGLTLAWFGYLAAPLTLFNVMALLLVLGVSVNYVIFLRAGIDRRGAALLGVLVSAATTVLSFGLLAWSSTPALAQFGATLFVGVTATVLLAPLLEPAGKKARS